MVEQYGNLFRVSGALTMAHAAGVQAAGLSMLKAGIPDLVVDLSQVDAADSSALAVLFAWKRVQHAAGHRMSVQGASEGLRAQADLYGVNALVDWA